MSDTITIDKGKIHELTSITDDGGFLCADFDATGHWWCRNDRNQWLLKVDTLDEACELLRSWGATRIEAEARFDLPIGEAKETEVVHAKA